MRGDAQPRKVYRPICLLVAFVAANSASLLGAQVSAPPFYMYPSIGTQMLQKDIDARRASSGQEAADRNSSIQSVSLRYSVSQQRRKANLAKFARHTRANNPDSAAKMEQLFSSTDIIAAFATALAPVDLRVDDVADAYAVYWMTAWGAAHGDTSTPSRGKAQAVKAQAARAMASSPEMALADDAAKQEFAEALLLQAAMIDAIGEEYRSDPAIGPKIATSVRQGARAAGLDLDAMTLTEQGFVPTQRTGATEPTSSDGQELATRDAEPSTPNYGLLAAMGGAGISAALLFGMIRQRG